MSILTFEPTKFRNAAAAFAVAESNARLEDEGWTYVVVVNEDGSAFVEVVDEENYVVGTL